MMFRQVASVAAICVAGVACTATSGCGGGGSEFDVVPISGTITCNGEPVGAGVLVQFVPDASGDAGTAVVGKMAQAVVQEDGSFTLSTYEQGDGAVVGRHRIIILPATPGALEEYEGDGEEPEEEAEDGEQSGEDDVIPLPCPAPGDLFVDVTASTTVVDIEMSGEGSVTTQ